MSLRPSKKQTKLQSAQAQRALQQLLLQSLTQSRLRHPSYSLRSLAQKIGCSPAAVSEILSNKRRVSKKIAARIIERLGIEPAAKQTLLSLFSTEPREQRQALAGVEHERDPRRGELLDVRAHPVATVRGDDAKRDAFDVADAVLVREVHRARVERSDLVVVEVRDDVGLRRVAAGHGAHAVGGDAEPGEAVAVRTVVVAGRRHDDRRAAQRLQVVGDVAGAAAPLAAHRPDLERHRQHVDLVREDVPPETVGEHHDGVDGEGTADQRAGGGLGGRRHVFSFAMGTAVGKGRRGDIAAAAVVRNGRDARGAPAARVIRC